MNSRPKSLVLVLAAALALSVLSPNAQAAGVPQAVAQATAALRQARALLQRGHADQALPQLELALQLYTESGATRGRAAANDALGDLYARQGQYARALKHYREAHEEFVEAQSKESAVVKAAGFSDNAFNADLMLAKVGEIAYRMGDIPGSSAAYSEMRVTKPQAGAVTTAKKAGGLFGGLKSLGQSVASGNISASTGSGVVGAVSSVQQLFDLYRQSIIYSTHELGLGRVDFFNDNLASARKHFEEALASAAGNIPVIGGLGQTRRFRVAARTSLGDIALRENRLKDAIKLYTEAAGGAAEDKRLDLAWPAQRGLGRTKLLMAAQERDAAKSAKIWDEALASYHDALRTIETLRLGSVRADESRTTFLATTKDVFDEAATALAERAFTEASKAGKLEGEPLAWAAEAFRIVEQGRARSLLDLLNETGASITEGVPADLLQKRQANLERQQEIAQQLSGVTLTEEPQKESVEKLEQELEGLNAEYESVENQIRVASPRYSTLTAAQPLSLADVQGQVLDENTALLEYFLGRDQSYLFTATKNSVALHKLPSRGALNIQIARLRDQIVPQSLRRSIVELGSQTRGLATERGLSVSAGATSGGGQAFAEAANTLYKAAVEPAAALFGDKRLLIIADGALNYVPFEALVTSAGTDYTTLPYLVKTNEIVYAPSASVVAAIRQQAQAARSATTRGLLVVADPIFDSTDARAKQASAPASDAAAQSPAVQSAVADVVGARSSNAPAVGFRLARLAGTRAEAQEIEKLARAAGLAPDLWLDLDASESNLKTRDLSKYRILHVATHGLLDAERPQFSGVVLSLVGNHDGDGFLRTDEIFNLRLGAQLVILSACETGLGKEQRGEGVMGLTRAFMYAGAPTVGVSLWSVADRSTAELMSDFYRRLLTKQSPNAPAALRAAQQQMIAGGRYSAPFYWAPFVLVGDWK